MKKPEFPPARLVREDFLPEPMRNYRIKKLTEYNTTWYYPQVKVLWWWHDLFSWNQHYIGYLSLEKAQEALCRHIKGTMVEYIDFDSDRDCK